MDFCPIVGLICTEREREREREREATGGETIRLNEEVGRAE